MNKTPTPTPPPTASSSSTTDWQVKEAGTLLELYKDSAKNAIKAINGLIMLYISVLIIGFTYYSSLIHKENISVDSFSVPFTIFQLTIKVKVIDTWFIAMLISLYLSIYLNRSMSVKKLVLLRLLRLYNRIKNIDLFYYLNSTLSATEAPVMLRKRSKNIEEKELQQRWSWYHKLVVHFSYLGVILCFILSIIDFVFYLRAADQDIQIIYSNSPSIFFSRMIIYGVLPLAIIVVVFNTSNSTFESFRQIEELFHKGFYKPIRQEIAKKPIAKDSTKQQMSSTEAKQT